MQTLLVGGSDQTTQQNSETHQSTQTKALVFGELGMRRTYPIIFLQNCQHHD